MAADAQANIGVAALPSWVKEFPQDPQLVYLNHAAVAPWPARTRHVIQQFADENVRWGATHYERWLAEETRLRERFATLLKAPSAEDIALVKNTSEGLSMVAHGLPWKAGDTIVISDEEFPSNRIVWESLAPRGVAVRAVSLRGRDPEAELICAIDGSTRLLSISSVQFGTGRCLDLTRLGAACKQRGVRFCVDAIQSIGALATDVQAMHADFVVADAHKWLLGPEGLAVFYCAASSRDGLALHEFGWHMVEKQGDFDTTHWSVAASARRFECGSPNMLGIFATSASVSLLLEIGEQEIERRLLDNARFLLNALGELPGVELITPTEAGRYAGIVTFRLTGVEPANAMARLREQNIICACRGGGIRFSPHFYTERARLERAVTAVAALRSAAK